MKRTKKNDWGCWPRLLKRVVGRKVEIIETPQAINA